MTKTKEDILYKRNLRIAGAMSLYGLDRKTAEQLCEDVDGLLQAREEEVVKMIITEIDTIRPHHEYCDAYGNHASGDRGCLRDEAQDQFAFKIIKFLRSLTKGEKK